MRYEYGGNVSGLGKECHDHPAGKLVHAKTGSGVSNLLLHLEPCLS